MDRLSLYQIESGLIELQDAWDDAEEIVVAEDRELAQQAVRDAVVSYIQKELDKIDSICGYIRHCAARAAEADAEAKRVATLAARWERRADLVKAMALYVMQAKGLKQITGRTNKLRRQKNGGVAPLLVPSAKDLGEEFKKYTLKLTWDELETLRDDANSGYCLESLLILDRATGEPDNEMIRKFLAAGVKVAGAVLGERAEGIRIEGP